MLVPTYNVGLQSFGHQAACDLQILWRTLSHLQTTGHAHSLQHLDVIVDLKHAVEVEQILKSVDEKEKETETVTRPFKANSTCPEHNNLECEA